MAILTACETCKEIGSHSKECTEANVSRGRRQVPLTITIDGEPVHLLAEFSTKPPFGWRAEFQWRGYSSREAPLGGLEEQRFQTHTIALTVAFSNALDRVLASRRGGA